MADLFLKFTDNNGSERRSAVSGDLFVVGRHSESDLAIPDGRLSRQHVRIERYSDVFIASDAGSSNGTKLNDNPLKDPTALKDGDILDLGGLRLQVEIVSDETADAGAGEAPVEGSDKLPVDEVGNTVVSQPAQVEAASSSGYGLLLLLIPVFGLILLLFAGGVIYLVMSGSSTTNAKKQTDVIYSRNESNEDDAPNKKSGNNTSTTGPSGTNNSTNSGTSDPGPGNNSSSPGKLGENAKIEANGGAFLRRIAQNDPRAFLTSEQAQRLSPKVKQLSGSSAVAENLSSARKNAAQIKSLAESKNLKPQFLAIAAVAKLGTNRGDVLQTAQGMSETLGKLKIQLGNEFGEDSLLIIAAYGQGASGEFMKMRNMLQDLANKFPESTRVIRTIWFLQKNGKITQSEFESALNFLAIGTISQNPKEFGVNAEALAL